MKQLEQDKKNLKQTINDLQHKLEIEQLDHINQQKRLNKERSKLVEAQETTTKVRDNFDKEKNALLNEISE